MFWEIMRSTTTFVPVSDGEVIISAAWFSFIFGILVFLGLVFAVAIHEFAHAWSAHVLGDDTAKYMGRMTLNPFKHFDMFGVILLLFAFFSYGKPVPVNPNNFRNPIQGNMFVALAGPMSNILQAIIYAILFLVLKQIPPEQGSLTSLSSFFDGFRTTFTYALPVIGFINIGLAVFNLLPIPPLDGSKIWGYFSTKVDDFINYTLSRYGFFIIILMIIPLFSNASILQIILSPFAEVYFRILAY